MDALDIRIIRAVGMDPWGRHPKPLDTFRPGKIARAAGISPERATERLRKMEEAGILRGWQLVPNFKLFGLESTCYFLRFPDESRIDAAAKQLEDLDRLVGLYFYLGPILCVNISFAGPAELERKLRILNAIAADAKVHKFYDLETPPIERPLSNLDWRIVKALRGNALRPAADVAAELNVSAKTVQRRVERMASEGAFFIVPKLDLRKAPGVLMMGVLVHLDPEATRGTIGAVAKALDENLVGSYAPTSLALGQYAAVMFGHSIAEVDDLRTRAAAVPGVRAVEAMVFRGARQSFSWIDEAIEGQVRATAAAPLMAKTT